MRGGHVAFFFVVWGAMTWYEYYQPTQSNGTVGAFVNFFGTLGVTLGQPYGVLNWSLFFGFIIALVAVYGIALLLFILVGRNVRMARK